MPAVSPVEYEPFSSVWRDDPYPKYSELRDRAPVHWAPESGVYCVSRYDDVLYVLKNPEVFSSRAMFDVLMNDGQSEPPKLTWPALKMIALYLFRTRMNVLALGSARNLIADDPPAHEPVRHIVNRGFTPGRIRAWDARIRDITDEQMQRLDPAGFCVMRDIAVPLPVTIIAEMLGVEPERRADFKRWSDGIIMGATGERRADRFHPETVRTVLELHGYLRKVIRQRRRAPRDDLISTIVADDGSGEPLTDLEAVNFVQLLLVAGNETTTNLIGNAASTLLDHPDQLERVAAEPSCIPILVDEALRYDSPIQLLFRTATRDVELAGTRIPAGAYVAPMLGSANRDERQFEDPDHFDPLRDPKTHLGFGFGRHFCLGSSLARLETAAALEALVPLLARSERARPSELLDSFLVRGPRTLELRAAA